MSFQVQNIFEAIAQYGHDEDFRPQIRGNWQPTNAVAGTTQKLEILRKRVELGVPLFHPNDNPECLRASNGSPLEMPSIRVFNLCRFRGTLLSE
jgi:hypothetical protein